MLEMKTILFSRYNRVDDKCSRESLRSPEEARVRRRCQCKLARTVDSRYCRNRFMDARKHAGVCGCHAPLCTSMCIIGNDLFDARFGNAGHRRKLRKTTRRKNKTGPRIDRSEEHTSEL